MYIYISGESIKTAKHGSGDGFYYAVRTYIYICTILHVCISPIFLIRRI